MKQDKLTAAQIAIAKRLQRRERGAIASLIRTEREQFGGLTWDAHRILDAAEVMLLNGVDENVVNSMVLHTASAIDGELQRQANKRKPGRPTKDWWHHKDRDAKLLSYGDVGTRRLQ